jgi:Protein of unknown function (DUF3105)
MAHRKDRKEELRRERERREAEARAAAQRKRLVGIGAAAAIAIAAIVVVVVLVAGGGGGSSDAKGGGDVFPDGGSVAKQQVFDLKKAAAAANCQLSSNLATSREHTSNVNQKVDYKQNPPNSGKHYQVPADDGLYQGAPPDVQLVHVQEHGRVVIWAKPSLPVEVRKQIRALFKEDSYQMVVVPRANMPYAVAATAWGRDPTPNGTGYTLGCKAWNANVIDAFRNFRDEHRSNGPEPIP